MPVFYSHSLEASLREWKLGLSARLISAGWFAGAACTPFVLAAILGFFLRGEFGRIDFRSGEQLWALWFFVAIPISAAALLGFTYGCKIIDPLYSISAGGAALRGALVAFFSFVLFITLYGVWLSTNSSQPASVSGVVGMVVMVFLFGFVLVGWLLLIIGAVAGWLLYRVSRKDHVRFLDLPRVKVQTANLWIAIAILLFLSNCAGVLLIGKTVQS